MVVAMYCHWSKLDRCIVKQIIFEKPEGTEGRVIGEYIQNIQLYISQCSKLQLHTVNLLFISIYNIHTCLISDYWFGPTQAIFIVY